MSGIVSAPDFSQPVESATDFLQPFYSQFQTESYLINYVKIGYGPIPIFAFSGIMSPVKSSFIPLIALMLTDPIFCAKYTFYSWDEPGYFGSNKPHRKMEDINFEKDVEMAHVLLKALSGEKFVLIGYSGGSQSALLFSINYPELVQKLIILGGWDRFEVDVVEEPASADNARIPDRIATMYQNEFGGNKELTYKHRAAWHHAIMEQYLRTDKKSWQKRYENFTIPTLIVWGSRDLVVPFEATLDLHKAIGCSRLVVVPGAPHNVHFMFPEKFFKMLKAFLQEHTFRTEKGLLSH